MSDSSLQVQVSISNQGFDPSQVYVLPGNQLVFSVKPGDMASYTLIIPQGLTSTPPPYQVSRNAPLTLEVAKQSQSSVVSYNIHSETNPGRQMTVAVNLIKVSSDGFQPVKVLASAGQELNFTVGSDPSEELTVTPSGLFDDNNFKVDKGATPKKEKVKSTASGKYMLQFEAPRDTIKMMIEVVTGGSEDGHKPRR